MSFYSSPGIDINYFLCTSPKHDVKVNRRNDLVNDYYGSFYDTLTSLNYPKIPTLPELEADLLRKEFYGTVKYIPEHLIIKLSPNFLGFFACISTMPIVLMETQSETGSGMDALLDEKKADSVREICFNGVRYKEAMKYFLKRFEELNILR
jgi:Ecdysteroid kinase-like family